MRQEQPKPQPTCRLWSWGGPLEVSQLKARGVLTTSIATGLGLPPRRVKNWASVFRGRAGPA